MVAKLFDALATRYKARAGGYTRVLKAGFPFTAITRRWRSLNSSTVMSRPAAELWPGYGMTVKRRKAQKPHNKNPPCWVEKGGWPQLPFLLTVSFS